jgi:hypothetical protein
VYSVPITTKVMSSNPVHGKVYSIQHYVKEVFSDLRQVGGFLWVHESHAMFCSFLLICLLICFNCLESAVPAYRVLIYISFDPIFSPLVILVVLLWLQSRWQVMNKERTGSAYDKWNICGRM